MSDSQQSSRGSRPGKFEPPSLESLDSVLSGYEFLEILGQGGMGAVYKVRQLSLDRLAAIKVMPRFDEEEGENYAERFQREAKAMGRLFHQNIVSVYEFGQTSDGMLYIVMEYIDGADLQQLMRTGGLTVDHLFDWIPQVCEALQYAHSQGIVHRDIKPGNIMISREGNVKVADFGLAKLTSGDGQNTRLTMTNMTMGTPDYVAPEALEEGIEIDHRADIYAVGVMLYEMLTGKVPRGSWRPPSMMNSHIDSRFDALVTRAMEADRDSRFQNISEISSALTSIWTTTDDAVPLIADKVPGGRTTSRGSGLASATGVTGKRGPGRSPQQAGGAKSGLWIGIAVMITLLLVAAGWYLMRPPSGTGEPPKMATAAKESVFQASSVPTREETPEAVGNQARQPEESTPIASATSTEPDAEKPVVQEPVGAPAIASGKMEESNAGAPPEPEAAVVATPKAGDSPVVPETTDGPKAAKSSIPAKGAMAAAPATAPLTEAGRRVAELLERYESGELCWRHMRNPWRNLPVSMCGHSNVSGIPLLRQETSIM
jgi:serine/threonine protein kinase